MTKAEEHYQKGNEYLDKNDFSMAESEYSEAILEDFSSTKDVEMWAHLNRGIARFNQGDQAGAYDDWSNVSRYDENPERIATAKKLSQNLNPSFRL